MQVYAATGAEGRRLAKLTLGAALGLILSSASWAQLGVGPLGGGPLSSNSATARRTPAPEKPVVPAPSAIPGAKAREPVAPPTRSMSDMHPTDALFDAINRGDIASARDALNRGADLNGVNVLGMTPMELSVDLGRNDISFLLLSMRGEDSGRGSRAVSHETAARDQATEKLPAAKLQSRPAKTARQRVLPAASVASGQPAHTVASPKLFANDGGTPLPSAGFLGFDQRPTQTDSVLR
jgi:hypothetical protein